MAQHPCPYLDECDAAKIAGQLDAILDELKTLKTAFPETEYGEVDVVGHRKYHDAKIAAAVAEQEFWQELKLDLAKKGTWALVVIVVGIILFGTGISRNHIWSIFK